MRGCRIAAKLWPVRAPILLMMICLAATVDLTGQPRVSGPGTGWFELPVTGGEETLDALGILPADRGIALPLIARALYGTVSGASSGGGIAVQIVEIFGAITRGAPLPVPPGTPARILAPLSDDAWRRVLELPPGAQELFPHLALQRGPMLVAAGAMQAGPGIRELLERDRTLLRLLLRTAPGVFATAAPALRVVDGVVPVPGGRAAEDAWTTLVGTAPSKPAEFIRDLCQKDDGRLARFFATMMAVEEPYLGALLMPTPSADRRDALRSLYAAARDAEPVWSVNDHPFQRGNADLAIALHAARVLDPAALPATARWWPALMGERIRTRRDATRVLGDRPLAVTFSDIIRTVLDGTQAERRDHIALLSIAAHRFGATPDPELPDLLLALGAMGDFRALLLTLDRLEVASPAVWAAAVTGARRVNEGQGRDRIEALSVFQGALAIVERARLVRSLDHATTERLIMSLGTAAATGEGGPVEAVARWIVDTLCPALPELDRPDRLTAETAYESRILQAMGGPTAPGDATINWEGLAYRVDLAASERSRLQRIRAIVPSPGLDKALASRRSEDLAAALVALVYTPALGDPEGAVMLSPDVVRRHDFGVGSHAPAGEAQAWLPPQERSGDGQPWRVSGALVGLDLGLARLALRRLAADEMPAVPTINLNDQLVLARTVMALNPYDLEDADRDALAASVARGRARLQEAGRDPAAIEALAREAGLPATLRQTLAWTLRVPGADPAAWFGLRDMYWLGRPTLDAARTARWGVIGEPVNGRLITRFPPPEPWEHFGGRPDAGLLGAQVPDLTLRIVEETVRLKLPARLVPALLAYATQDFWHDVDARFPDDWPAMVRRAAVVPATRVEDYVAAVAGDGPLRPR